MHVDIHESWQEALGEYLATDTFKELVEKVKKDYLDKNQIVYPPIADLFRAFNETPVSEVKVVIIGQDPYHNPGQAHGLCFSVPEGTPTPPSLRNIFKEIQNDVYAKSEQRGSTSLLSTSTDLTRWATQGVFLLNSVLTVLEGQPASHSCLNTTSPNGLRSGSWQDFTDHVITTISDTQENVVFMLWGAYARSKAELIDSDKHLILEAPHPSPLSAYRGFFGCKHFSKANEYLKKHSKKAIEW